MLTILLLVAVFGFSPVNGARRWIKFRGFSIQPSEIVQTGARDLSGVLSREARRRGSDSSGERFFPAVSSRVLAALIVVEPDFGTAMMLAVIFVVVILHGRRAAAASGDGGSCRRCCSWRAC